MTACIYMYIQLMYMYNVMLQGFPSFCALILRMNLDFHSPFLSGGSKVISRIIAWNEGEPGMRLHVTAVVLSGS